MKNLLEQAKPPTCFENRAVYALIQEYVKDIGQARERLNLKLDVPAPKYGSLPVPDINAATYPATETRESIIAFNTLLFMFDYRLTKVLLRTIDIHNDNGGRYVAVDASSRQAKKALDSDPEVKIDFALAIAEFLFLAPPSNPQLDQANDPLLISLTMGMEIFGVGHEYAHVLKKHQSPTTTLALNEDPTYVAPDNKDIPVLSRSWQQELEADDLGVQLLLQVLRTKAENNAGDRLRWLYMFQGAKFFFKCMDVVDKAKYIDAHGILPPELSEEEKAYIRAVANNTASEAQKRKFAKFPIDKSHPPAWLRFERIAQAMDKYLAEMKIESDALEFGNIGIALVANVDVLWNTTAPRLPILVRTLKSAQQGQIQNLPTTTNQFRGVHQ